MLYRLHVFYIIFLRKNSISYNTGFRINEQNDNCNWGNDSLQPDPKKNYSSDAKQNRKKYFEFFNEKSKVEMLIIV